MKRILLIVLALLVAPLAAAPSPARVWQFLTEWEGYRTRPYRDGPGWSVGVGHSLSANRERGIWSRPYTHAEITRLFNSDLSWATDACRLGVRDWDRLPETAQLVSLSVAWCVGRTGFHNLTAFRSALGRRDYRAAAGALRRYAWAQQVGPARTQHHTSLLLSLSNPP